MQSHEQLKVWRKAVSVSVDMYRITETFPARETYGLSSQMRRAAVSAASNIAEGRWYGTDANFRYFLRIAHGSTAELETQLLIAKELSFCNSNDYEALRLRIGEIGKMLHGMMKVLR